MSLGRRTARPRSIFSTAWRMHSAMSGFRVTPWPATSPLMPRSAAATSGAQQVRARMAGGDGEPRQGAKTSASSGGGMTF